MHFVILGHHPTVATAKIHGIVDSDNATAAVGIKRIVML
jgi:hypothetical protein